MLALALADYLAAVLPLVRRQLRAWRREAEAIPDPTLRRHALAALTEKGSNPEAVAVFAILAPWRRRRAAVGAIVALQVAIDYLDSLGEQPGPEPLADGLQLHRALVAAVRPGAAGEDWYRLHPHRNDGGYLARLVQACQRHLASQPALAAVQPRLEQAAARCGEGQSRTHAAGHGDGAPLEEWAQGLGAPAAYRWWEVAAGASSSVAAHVLIAAAASPRTDADLAARLDAAYFPSIGALTVLLDDLVDREEDAARGEHNYLARYADDGEAAARLGSILADADARLAGLPARRRHLAILDGVLGFYLGAAAAPAAIAGPVRARLPLARAARVGTIAAVAALQRRTGPAS